jgi:hypothetical protein
MARGFESSRYDDHRISANVARQLPAKPVLEAAKTIAKGRLAA